MKKLAAACSALFGTSLLLACASQPPVPGLTVKPTLRVANPGEKPDAWYQVGRYYQGQNRLDQAIDAYRKALVLDSGFVDAHNALGAVYAAQGRLEEAVTEFKIVVAALPVTSYAWSNLGYAYLLQGKPADAVAALERATAFDLTNQRALNNLGTALAQLGENAAANEKFARAAELATGAPGASSVASAAQAPATSPAAEPIAPAASVPTVVPAAKIPVASVVPAVVPTAVLIAPAAAVPVAIPVELSAATPIVAAPTSALPDAGERVPRDVTTEANAPVELGSQPVAVADSAIEQRSIVAAVIDNTGAGKLVQLAPNVYELRLAVAPPIVAALPAGQTYAEEYVPLDKPAETNAPVERGPQLGSQLTAVADSAKEARPLVAAVIDNTGASELVQLAPNVFELRLAPTPLATAAQQPMAAQSFRLELSNGNGVTGMARRLGEQLIAKGLPKARLTNQKPFRQRATVIQYREGYAAVAESLQRRMPNQPPVVKAAVLRPSTDVRVVLGKDLPRDVALFEPTQLANAAQNAVDDAE